jgi:hypothetical protein
MTRRWRGLLLAAVAVAVIAADLLIRASRRPGGHDVQPWLGLAAFIAIVGGAVGVFDSWSKGRKREEQPTDSERKNW